MVQAGRIGVFWGYPEAMGTHLTQAGLECTQCPDTAKGIAAGVINDRSATGRQLGGGKKHKLGSLSQPWHAENVAGGLGVDTAGRQSSPKIPAGANQQNNRKNSAWLRQGLHRTLGQQEGCQPPSLEIAGPQAQAAPTTPTLSSHNSRTWELLGVVLDC
jgi:hypothetical protein